MAKKIIIIGGVAAGMKTASRLRRLDKNAQITVLDRGTCVSFSACGFPYYVGGDVASFDSLLGGVQGKRDPEFFKEVKGFDVLIKHEATKINRDKKTVSVVNLETKKEFELEYDKLVLATGSTPVKLPIPGSDLKGVHNFWFPEEAFRVRKDVESGKIKDVVIVGAGLIGIELAEAFHKQGVKVHIVEMQNRILPQLLDLDLADKVKKPLIEAGIDLHLEEKTLSFEGSETVEAVKTDKGIIPAQMVIVCVGVRPNVELAKDAGLKIGVSGAIEVNKRLQTSDPDIFAGGDCAENTHRISKMKFFAPMGSTANKHGRVIANNIAGKCTSYPGILLTGVCKVLDWEAGCTGLNSVTAEAAGIDYECVVVAGKDRLGYMPGANMLILKLYAEKGTRKVLGVQAVGEGGVAKRVDVIATAITFGATLDDLSTLDMAYAPPFNAAVDNISTAANVLINKMECQIGSMNCEDFKEVRKKPEVTFVDVRTPSEFKETHISGCCNIINLPLDKIRAEAEKVLTDKNAKYITACMVNLRGSEGEVILKAKGYTHTSSLEGGLAAWPYETECEKNK
jgi:NADPH-dependent 2,4-dienoyl-CoA reductase/sulfur reductase-like enzyme/rhodanese-related sulfurtransferase